MFMLENSLSLFERYMCKMGKVLVTRMLWIVFDEVCFNNFIPDYRDMFLRRN